ncbi:MAG: cytochrome c biogenesis protein ResB, partial [Oscillospiraceae bacterium]|nr:cytochrome c biogenesis protein ResB [Oscillospiraceae bacterium]
MKKIGKFLSSMPFAIMLLVLLAAACAISSTVTQGQSYDDYAAQYGDRMAGLILALRLDDAFHSGWLIGLSA